ncbi:unnamed protein product [Prunus armeniaca]|uniref:FAD-binding FR-type domain-containing protein n=1 Tax=Prunus armeniaca TaxID=36596 RepID=A0A6J5WTA0_PRUAR|nr:unnamed protein product [Prunus armeniaca]
MVVQARKWNTSTWELYALIREYLSLITWLFTWSYHQLWTRKWKAAEDKARATLFGHHGLNFAVYTFPPIALAIIGSFFLNLKPRESIRRLEIDRWLLKSIGREHRSGWQLRYLKVETRFGLLAEVCLAFLLFPILRDMGMADIPCWGDLSGHRVSDLDHITSSNKEKTHESSPPKAIELILPKDPGPKYTPTSIIFVKVPSISKYEWHSFSITSSSRVDDNTISIMIKSEGSWTSSLSHMIQTRQESDGDQKKYIPIAVEGPYGPFPDETGGSDIGVLLYGPETTKESVGHQFARKNVELRSRNPISASTPSISHQNP